VTDGASARRSQESSAGPARFALRSAHAVLCILQGRARLRTWTRGLHSQRLSYVRREPSRVLQWRDSSNRAADSRGRRLWHAPDHVLGKRV